MSDTNGLSSPSSSFFSSNAKEGFSPEECDAVCNVEDCGELFPIAVCGFECPGCGNQDPEKMQIKTTEDGKVPFSFYSINKPRWHKSTALKFGLIPEKKS